MQSFCIKLCPTLNIVWVSGKEQARLKDLDQVKKNKNKKRSFRLPGCPLSVVDFDVKEDEKGKLFRFLQTQVKFRFSLTCCELDKFLLLVQADKEAVSQWRGALGLWAAGGSGRWKLDIQNPAQERWLDLFFFNLNIFSSLPCRILCF